MKRLVFIFALAAMLLLGSESFPRTAAARTNALRPQGAAAPPATLASSGKARYAILVPANPDAKVQKAADELAHWLREMSGADFTIVQEDRSAALPAHFISVGRTQALQKADPPQLSEKLNDEGTGIAQADGNLYLFGGPRRGPIFAVMALLEEDLDCRWYAPGVSVIPHRSNLTVAVVPRVENTPLTMERNNYFDGYDKKYYDSDWNLRNRLCPAFGSEIDPAYGGDLQYARGRYFVHTYQWLIPAKEYFADHPDYFALINGKRDKRQLDETNPEVRRLMIEKVRAILKADPRARIISISRNDGPGYCQCPRCAAINQANHSHGAAALDLVNAVADALGKEFPNVEFDYLAYLDTLAPPTQLKPHKNVSIRICNSLDAFAHPLSVFPTASWKRAVDYRKIVAGWGRIASSIHIWEYTINYYSQLSPLPNMRVIAPELRYYIKQGATGMMFQAGSDGNGRHSERSALRAWVYAKLMWNPSLDTGSLIRDFNEGYFAQAAPFVQAYDDRLDQIGRSYGNREIPGGLLFKMTADLSWLSKDFIAKARTLFDQAESAVKNDPAVLQRVKMARLPVEYVVLSRPEDYPAGQYAAALNRVKKLVKNQNLKRKDVNNALPKWEQTAREKEKNKS